MDQQTAINAAFSVPAPSGAFDGETAARLAAFGARRRSVVLAFAPKAAGTFLRSAAVIAADGQLIRTVHAQGERDAQFYLPTFLGYYLGQVTPHTLVTHVHMQALTANRCFIEALDLKPIVMLRAIPDMLASYWDMLERDPEARTEGLNCRIPAGFTAMPRATKADFLIDMLAPWYASYYATWLSYAAEQPERVCVVDYNDFRRDPAAALQQLLAHSGIARPIETCRDAIAQSWQQRDAMRFNRGVAGRGRDYFSDRHIARVERLLAHYDLPPQMQRLLVGRDVLATA